MNQRLLIISVSGIGNTILQSPLISFLLNSPKYDVDILFGNPAMAAIFEGHKGINNAFILPKSNRGIFRFLMNLVIRRYDITLACFPSNRIHFNVLPLLLMARQRIIHRYPFGRLRTLGFLSNKKVPIDETLHDVEQNLNLLKALDEDPLRAKKTLFYKVTEAERSFAKEYIKSMGIDKRPIIGIHPGCLKSNKERRWPGDYFVRFIKNVNREGYNTFIIAGPDEFEETKQIWSKVDNKRNILISGSIRRVASLISQCERFLSTDSGPGHIAAALNIPTLAIVGPAMETRTAPYGQRCSAITHDIPCRPCMKYPFKATNPKIRCNNDYRCLKEIKPDEVLRAVLSL